MNLSLTSSPGFNINVHWGHKFITVSSNQSLHSLYTCNKRVKAPLWTTVGVLKETTENQASSFSLFPHNLEFSF